MRTFSTFSKKVLRPLRQMEDKFNELPFIFNKSKLLTGKPSKIAICFVQMSDVYNCVCGKIMPFNGVIVECRL